jgi:hypothetical protein
MKERAAIEQVAAVVHRPRTDRAARMLKRGFGSRQKGGSLASRTSIQSFQHRGVKKKGFTAERTQKHRGRGRGSKLETGSSKLAKAQVRARGTIIDFQISILWVDVFSLGCGGKAAPFILSPATDGAAPGRNCPSCRRYSRTPRGGWVRARSWRSRRGAGGGDAWRRIRTTPPRT